MAPDPIAPYNRRETHGHNRESWPCHVQGKSMQDLRELGSSLFTGIFSQVNTHHSGVHLAEMFPALKYT